jgi:hypothetical protein
VGGTTCILSISNISTTCEAVWQKHLDGAIADREDVREDAGYLSDPYCEEDMWPLAS